MNPRIGRPPSSVQSGYFTKMRDEDPICLADMIISGEIAAYLREYAEDYKKQKMNMLQDLEKTHSQSSAEAIAWDFMTCDS